MKDIIEQTFPYSYIAIEGNIGTGKTTLCKMLAAEYGCTLILEQFTENPFLPFFYQNPERYAFPVELFFMTERHKQLQEHHAIPNLFRTFTVSDYFFLKTLLFAKNNLNSEEFRLFQRLFHVLNNASPKPDVLFYLHRPTDMLLAQIQKRGREIEKHIEAPYLDSIKSAYFDYFKSETEIPVVIIELNDADFVEQPEYYLQIKSILHTKYTKPGMHHEKIHL